MPGKTRKKRWSAPLLLRRLRKHFDAEPADLPVVEQHFEMHDRPNLHLAIEELLAGPGRQAELVGVLARDEYHSPSLGRLSRKASAKQFEQGPVEYVDVPLPGGQHLACVKSGLYLVREEDRPLALLVTMPLHSHPPLLQVEVMAADRERAEQFLRRLQRRTSHGQASVHLDHQSSRYFGAGVGGPARPGRSGHRGAAARRRVPAAVVRTLQPRRAA